MTLKRSFGLSPFQLVYGVEEIFLSQLALPMAKFLQDYQGELDHMIKRIQQLVEVQQTREQLVDKAYDHQLKIKHAFDKKVNKEDFQLGDLVLKWDAPRQDKGKNYKFEALWVSPFKISEVFSNNTFKLQNMDDEEVFGGPVKSEFSKKVLCWSLNWLFMSL
jgi:hypothetical protein